MFETTLRYNSLNNKHAIEGELPRFDSVIIDAKMLAHSRKAIPRFIQQLCDERSLQYYVDPIMSDFRAGSNFRFSDGTVRGWYDAYVTTLGNPLERILTEQKNADPRTLRERDVQAIARSMVHFQETFVARALNEESGDTENVRVQDVSPKAVVPWHHRIHEIADIAPNRTILEASVEEATIPVKPCLHTTKSFIRSAKHRAELVRFTKSFNGQELFLLVEELGKHETDERTYKAVIDLVYDLSEVGIRPHFYYGDFFSNLLAYFGLCGTTYGVMYGEEYRENLEYRETGGMLNRYYIEKIKDFLKVPAAVELMTRTGTDVCECEVCQRHFSEWGDVIRRQESDDNLMNILQKHYVEKRWEHARMVEERSFSEVLDELETNYQQYVSPYANAHQISPNKAFDYLPRWIHAASDRKALATKTP